MKRNFLLALLILALLLPAFPASAEARTLQLEILNTYVTGEWEGETSDIHVWLAVQATATNWRTESVALSESIQAQLIIQDAYVFEATPEFGSDSIDPLVQLNGALLFRIPGMAAELLDDSVLVIEVDGETVMEEKPEVSKRVSASRVAGSFEGPGFDSPEDAALAYIEAFNAGDVQGMISTFAIETYVDHVDRQATIERFRASNNGIQDSCPMPTPYVRDLMVSERCGNIATQLYRQYLLFAMPEEYRDDPYRPVTFKSDDRSQEISNFLDAFDNSPVNEWIGNIVFVGFVSLEELTGVGFVDPDFSVADHFMDERNQENLNRMMACRGCDELAEIVVHIQINGKDYYQCLECARYGDRWYVQNLGGNIGALLNMSSYIAGLLPLDGELDWIS